MTKVYLLMAYNYPYKILSTYAKAAAEARKLARDECLNEDEAEEICTIEECVIDGPEICT